MVLFVNHNLQHDLIGEAEGSDKSYVDTGGKELDFIRNFFSILLNIRLLPSFHHNLSSDYSNDEEDRDRDADENRSCRGVEAGHLVGRLGLLVNELGCFEFFTFSGGILEIAHEPQVGDSVLLALPALNEVGGPQDDKDGIDRVRR